MVKDPLDQFRDAIIAAGMSVPEHIEADGVLHRFSTNGKPGDDSGWYVLHLDDTPAGAFGCWREGINQTWRADIGRKLTDEEQKAHRAKVAAMRKAREAEERRGHQEAAAKAEAIWNAANPATGEHPYLKRKGVGPHGTHVAKDGRLLVPMHDADGKLWNLEHIAPEKPPDGGPDKKGLHQGRRTDCFFTFGTIEEGPVLCLCEGFATGASIHEATGYPVAVAFTAGNLKPVAKTLRRKWPDLPIILCADNDLDTEAKGKGNPGLTKAKDAAKATGGLVALPGFGPERPEGATDFNDLHRAQGLEAVKQQVEGVIEASGIEQSDPARSVDPPAPSTFPPSEDERPCYRVLDDWHKSDGRRYKPGVYFCDAKTQKDGSTALVNTWICSPLYVVAVTFDGQKDNFGRLLRFLTTLNEWCEWAMPMEMLSGYGDELRGALLAMGVNLDPNHARKLLPMYLQHRVPNRRMRCAMQTGWAGPGAFVLPDTVIGPNAAGVTYQSLERGHAEYTTAGTLDGWREKIAARAVGNPLLMLALSAGFAGPLLYLVHAESGGLHLYGGSSTGKTTLIEAACSVWGGETYKRSWRATANGTEGAAALFTDGLLAPDEISECDAREVGKQRASRSGAARRVTRWRCVVLSSGERTIETSIHAGGGKIKAGQTVRLLDVPVARTYGAWDDLHGMESGAAFSDAIKQAAKTHYGHPGRAFLERLTRDNRDWSAYFEQAKALSIFSQATEGQAKRVAARFALYGMAGELATGYGLTGWPEGDAFKAAGEGFWLWLSERGHGNDEKRQILEQVSDFIDQHGDARFSNAKETPSDRGPMIRDRAGWWRKTDDGDGRIYLFHSQGMKEALKGFDFKRGLEALQDAGVLEPGGGGKRSQSVTPAGGKKTRVYSINANRLAEAHHVP